MRTKASIFVLGNTSINISLKLCGCKKRLIMINQIETNIIFPYKIRPPSESIYISTHMVDGKALLKKSVILAFPMTKLFIKQWNNLFLALLSLVTRSSHHAPLFL